MPKPIPALAALAVLALCLAPVPAALALDVRLDARCALAMPAHADPGVARYRILACAADKLVSRAVERLAGDPLIASLELPGPEFAFYARAFIHPDKTAASCAPKDGALTCVATMSAAVDPQALHLKILAAMDNQALADLARLAANKADMANKKADLLAELLLKKSITFSAPPAWTPASPSTTLKPVMAEE